MSEEDVGYQEPLDEKTEMVITSVRGAADNFGRLGQTPREFRILEKQTDALRSRIRFLVEEAVKAEKARIIRECEAIPIGEMTHVDYDDD